MVSDAVPSQSDEVQCSRTLLDSAWLDCCSHARNDPAAVRLGLLQDLRPIRRTERGKAAARDGHLRWLDLRHRIHWRRGSISLLLRLFSIGRILDASHAKINLRGSPPTRDGLFRLRGQFRRRSRHALVVRCVITEGKQHALQDPHERAARLGFDGRSNGHCPASHQCHSHCTGYCIGRRVEIDIGGHLLRTVDHAQRPTPG